MSEAGEFQSSLLYARGHCFRYTTIEWGRNSYRLVAHTNTVTDTVLNLMYLSFGMKWDILAVLLLAKYTENSADSIWHQYSLDCFVIEYSMMISVVCPVSKWSLVLNFCIYGLIVTNKWCCFDRQENIWLNEEDGIWSRYGTQLKSLEGIRLDSNLKYLDAAKGGYRLNF